MTKSILKTVNYVLLTASIVATLAAIHYLAKAWTLSLGEWVEYIFHYVWAILPFIMLWWLNQKSPANRKQLMIVLVFLCIEITVGVVGYSIAIEAELHPKLSLLLTTLPLYQFILSVFAVPLFYLSADK